MSDIPWELIFAGLGVLVPIAAALYEFAFVGRKRLGYRIQMDTTAADADPAHDAGALQQLRQSPDGAPLKSPSFVLLRIENDGATNIDTNDYAVPDDDKVGIRVVFPGRRVAGMVVTELSHENLRSSFAPGKGLSRRDNVIELPRVPMNPSQHYKVLAVLDRTPESLAAPDLVKDPQVIGGIKGGVARGVIKGSASEDVARGEHKDGHGFGVIKETKSQTGVSWQIVGLVVFLVLIIIGQLTFSLTKVQAPLDCATGKLTLVGSTAFKPVLDAAERQYENTCPGADITVRTEGSAEGLERLDKDRGKDNTTKGAIVAFSDGMTANSQQANLLPRPMAFLLFSLVINKEAGVQNLPLDKIRAVYSGQYTNWEQLGGNDVPIRLVSRHSDSGTRRAFEQRVLLDVEPGRNSDDCFEPNNPGRPAVIRCDRGSTDELLSTVADTPGAIGYSEVGAADVAKADGKVFPLYVNGRTATVENAEHWLYPYWETEYAYTYGEPEADSLAAGFLRYMTNEVGQDVVSSFGHRPCSRLQNPVLCQPEMPTGPQGTPPAPQAGQPPN